MLSQTRKLHFVPILRSDKFTARGGSKKQLAESRPAPGQFAAQLFPGDGLLPILVDGGQPPGEFSLLCRGQGDVRVVEAIPKLVDQG